MRKSVWLLSAGLFAISAPAVAQQTTDTDQGTAQPTPGATEGAAVDSQAVEQQPVDTGEAGEIVVTATRRNEALSDVPLAVSAVTAETIENSGIVDIRQLNQVSPTLLVSSTSSEAGAGVARIRGIGTVGDNPGLESSVGTFIDGVYRSRTGTGLTELGQIDRIEVLRGPQGTLFGRNTSAGLISIITAKPRFQTAFNGELTIGNYDLRRVELGATGPISSTLATRVDAVYLKRDGFLEDVISGRDVNDRDRYLLRGQLLFQPNDDVSVRLIADYAKRDEECCAAPYLRTFDVNAVNGEAVESPSSVRRILEGLGARINDDTFDREVSITPGRSFRSDVKDGGLSGELVYDFGGMELTSITAYRYNKYVRGQDADFNNLDIVFRDDDGGAFNRFKTFSQELRLQGTTFNDRLDWLVGGYYANEKLRVLDNIAFGADYPRYANCLVANNFVGATGQAALLSPGVSPTCFQPLVAAGVQAALLGQFNAAVAAGNLTAARLAAGNIGVISAFARLNSPLLTFPTPGGPVVLSPPANFGSAAFGNNGFGNVALAFGGGARGFAGTNDMFDQTSNNLALFTHNIFSITDALKLTVGARYTREKKTLDVDLNDTGGPSLCSFFSGGPLASLQQLPCIIPTLPGGTFSEKDSRTENKLSGTAVLSWKPTDELLTYASYSRGYKAGGYNLDRSGLTRTIALNSSGVPVPGAVTTAASLQDLEFRPEINDAMEIGAKYNGRGFDVNVAVYRQLFKDFQLNTFNGLNFFVENINSCEDDLNGADTDNSQVVPTGECTGDTRAGVKSRGIEVEVFTRPLANVTFNLGGTLGDTKYRKNLVGAGGRALSPALFQLPGRRVSNSSAFVGTASLGWTPPIGGSGLRGLFYIDMRHQSEFNTGSDLDIEKIDNGYTVFNGRVGLRGPKDLWAVELWGQNLLDTNYKQVAFDAFLQGSCTTRGALNGFCSNNAPNLNRSTQLFGAFLAEPRTYGLTLRMKFAPEGRPAEVAPPAPLPPPPPPPPAPTQTCADGSVILATDSCPLPPPPPPPPAPEPVRG
ncbi:TonB-dependent receptor [Sphingomonas sp. GCM10030256]|uniref:TonB-dependent receptor n=1 Tax=Sphingomonas sp. GCM10030256 TaxID=3273427 RepID=UPI00361AAAD0